MENNTIINKNNTRVDSEFCILTTVNLLFPHLVYTMEYYSAIRKDEILLIETTWTDFENIMLSKISQTEKVKNCVISLTCRI